MGVRKYVLRSSTDTRVCRRIIINIKRTKNNEKENEKHRFNEVQQLPTSSRQKRREILFINQFTLQLMEAIPFFI